MTDETSVPIVVAKTPFGEITDKGVRDVLMIGFVLLAEHFARTEAGVGAIVLCGGSIVGAATVFVVGVFKHLQSHKQKVALANAVPDTVAVVKT